MSTELPPLPPDIGRIVGPELIGFMLNWGFFCVLSVQTFLYHLAFPSDPRRIKFLVIGVYLFEATQTFLLTRSFFHGFAESFGNIIEIDRIDTKWFSVPIMGGIVAFIVQSFYAYQIHSLSRSKTAAGLIISLSLVQLGGAIATGFEMKQAVFNSRFLGKSSFITLGIWNGGSALCDGITIMCMTMLLSFHKTNTKETAAFLHRTVRFKLMIVTATFSALVGILNLALSLLRGHPTYYQGVIVTLGKLYSNSMIVNLNGRMKIAPSLVTDSPVRSSRDLDQTERERS